MTGTERLTLALFVGGCSTPIPPAIARGRAPIPKAEQIEWAASPVWTGMEKRNFLPKQSSKPGPLYRLKDLGTRAIYILLYMSNSIHNRKDR